ncbi:MAG: hypothetical protein CVT49_10245 [candidate division Zixibacteria bacterium HGW-Zixibacteria-1]|nr:MAG: hypothetical protein CVT49_10245 [candidate division Zixibacteria bacterium HGW-Zixibacteria-1]
MPGLSLITIPGLSPQKAENSFALLKHLPKFNIEQIISAKNIAAAFCGYNGYPRLSFDEPDRFILIEGLIYNITDDLIKSRLFDIADKFRRNDTYPDAVRQFMHDADGDYLVLIYLKQDNRLLFFNDRWGRLPVYYSLSDQMLALSREVKFVLEWVPSIQYDVQALAEFLTLEYILGDKTFFKNIHRLGPASALTVNINDAFIKTEIFNNIVPVSFKHNDTGLSRSGAAGRYLDLFRQSLTWRHDKLREKELSIVADLSGGYDTRAVFAGLCEMKADFTACTDKLITGDETGTARRLAGLYEKDIHIMSAAHPVDDITEMTRILYITDGLVNGLIDTSCYYDDLERENKLPGPFANFKGMGGEFIRWVYMPKKGYHHLADAIIDDGYNHYMKMSDACPLLSLKKSELHDSLVLDIDRYDETDPVAQTRHLFFDYNNKTVNSGEDRNRLFCWTVAPMWGNHLFSFAAEMIPPGYIDYDFFALFLKLLSPQSLNIPMYGSGVRFDSALSRIMFRNRMKIKRTVRDNRYLFKAGQWIRGKAGPRRYIETEHARLAGEIRKLYDNCETVKSHFDPGCLDRYLNGRPDRLHLYQLLTLILYMNEVERRYRQKLILQR